MQPQEPQARFEIREIRKGLFRVTLIYPEGRKTTYCREDEIIGVKDQLAEKMAGNDWED